MYEVRTAGLKGLGVFATSIIPRGTRILSERPLLGIRYGQNQGDVYPAFRLLSLKDQNRLLSLSGHKTTGTALIRWGVVVWYTFRGIFSGNLLWRLREHNRLLNIFRTNSFSLNSGSEFATAIFPRIARLNHACMPNAQGNFDDEGGVLNVHALRDIKEGTELTLSYLDDKGMLRDERMEQLKTYGFECGCEICDIKTSLGRDSEKRRETMRKSIEIFAQDEGGKGKKGELDVLMKVIGMMSEEGFAGREIAAMYFGAAKLNAQIGEKAEALRCAEKGLKIDEHCLGKDHRTYRESLVKFEEYRQALGGKSVGGYPPTTSTDEFLRV